MGSIRSLVLMQLMILLNVILTVKASTPAVAKPGCRSRCGDVIIPYPFGTGGDCNITAGFFINCSTSFIPHKPFFGGNIEVINISTDGQLRILSNTSYDCYNTSYRNWLFYHLRFFEFSINNNKNKFTAIGCDTYAVVQGFYGQRYATGCLSLCNNITDVSNGSCSGIGCCQTRIPKDVTSYNISLASYANHTNVLLENPCSYAFVAEIDNYTFSASDLRGFEFQGKQFPITLDWKIGNRSCNEANMDVNNFACKEYSKCVDSENNSGYLCKCLEGYVGNPYLPNGCQDINECESMSPCNGMARCTNLPGTYNCSCPVGYEGDGKKSGTGCSLPNKDQSKTSLIVVALGICLAAGFSLFLAGVWWLYGKLEKRRNIKRKQEHFKRNGGLLLEKKLSSKEGGVENIKFFTSNHYNENRILGRGGQGVVYKGMLHDGRIVAVKKSKIVDQEHLDPFINEIVILAKIDHRNVVKLLGCCLETEVPLLVYEFIPNGTLSQLIHDQNEEYPRSWDMRLRIAAEVSNAISYLHSSASVPIYHRDIKSSNILLDEKFRAKVSDFGTSRSIGIDQTHLTTQVQGTFGYLDPEYFQSSQFTEKSDVYSFGVVLVELLTAQKPVLTSGSQEKKSLVSYFISSVDQNHFLDTLDPQVLKDGQNEELVAVAYLAKRCLNLDGKDRPTMKEVAMELERIRVLRGFFPTQPKQAEVVATKPTEIRDFTSSSNGFYMDSIITSVSDAHPLMSDTF
ncbi:hypothetical protein CXB51_005970 [Gossypium anomalum]|uniref:Uncharacterized protein n=1 Tax=Gossypium anomalum TaxID=47600 RepID=A0A8J5Z1P8_9ROSI|nr:hypothetical protein CXB51_005970 [Gossypium anomalum]